MKKTFLLFVTAFTVCSVKAQQLDFDKPSLTIKEVKEKVTETIGFSIKTKKDSVKVTIADKNKLSAEKGKDYEIEGLGDIWLCKENEYKGKIKLVVLPDNFIEVIEDGIVNFSFKNPDDTAKTIEQQFNFSISNAADGSSDAPVYTQKELQRKRGVNFEMYTGGNFDFFEALKFKNVGGEIILDANSISPGKNRRWGFTTGIFNFNTISYDSSNGYVSTYLTNIDTSRRLRTDTSLIVSSTVINHGRVSSNLWGYYFNPTFRLNKEHSEFFSWYLALEVELIRINTKYENDQELFRRDTALYNPVRFPNAVFVKDPIPVKNFSKQTNGYFGIGLPMYLDASDKVKFFFQPNIGVATYDYYVREYDVFTRKLIFDGYKRDIRSYFHCKFRASEQYTGLRITIGGEIRQIKNTEPLINMYLGLKVDLAKWFKK